MEEAGNLIFFFKSHPFWKCHVSSKVFRGYGWDPYFWCIFESFHFSMGFWGPKATLFEGDLNPTWMSQEVSKRCKSLVSGL